MKNQPPVPPAHEPSEEQIQELAYHLWIEGGRREGVELDNWNAARELLRHRHGHAHGHAPRGTHTGTNGTPKAPA